MAPVSTPEANAGSSVSQSSLLDRFKIPCAKPSESTASASRVVSTRVKRFTYPPPAFLFLRSCGRLYHGGDGALAWVKGCCGPGERSAKIRRSAVELHGVRFGCMAGGGEGNA